MNAIFVEKLRKDFDQFTAVNEISFSVPDGELFGFLGPNGAGKTTTINMLSTLLRPTSGHATVAGFDIIHDKNDVRKSIGIVFQEPALDSHLTGRENLVFHSMMYGIPRKIREKKINEVLELVELSDKAGVLVEKYSGGMKRRLEIARGLIQEPKVLFLDEPTLGLDAQTRRHIWDYIKNLNKERKVTIILTTHYMEEADYLCDRIAIIDHGKIVAMDLPGNLKDTLGGDVVSLQTENEPERLTEILRQTAWIHTCIRNEDRIDVTLEQGAKRIPELVLMAQQIGVVINSVNLRRPSLEDVFIHFTGKTIREQDADNRFVSSRKRRMR